MTWIRDENGTRWVELPVRERRHLTGPRRFDAVKVGDFLMQDSISNWFGGGKSGSTQQRYYAVVTDLWFDPVRGEHEHQKGEMVAIQMILNGRPAGSKRGHTIRGLASNGWHYADRDPVAEHEAMVAAAASGQLVGIGHAQQIRRRLKLPGRGL